MFLQKPLSARRIDPRVQPKIDATWPRRSKSADQVRLCPDSAFECGSSPGRRPSFTLIHSILPFRCLHTLANGTVRLECATCSVFGDPLLRELPGSMSRLFPASLPRHSSSEPILFPLGPRGVRRDRTRTSTDTGSWHMPVSDPFRPHNSKVDKLGWAARFRSHG